MRKVCPKQYWKEFKESSPNNIIAITFAPGPVAYDEPLARYLTSSNHFSREKNIVKPTAFMPPPDLRLSVFRINELDENSIWAIAIDNIMRNKNSETSLYGRAEILSSNVLSCNLSIDPDNTPPRHANIVGWPKEKDQQKMKALELAKKATLRLKN